MREKIYAPAAASHYQWRPLVSVESTRDDTDLLSMGDALVSVARLSVEAVPIMLFGKRDEFYRDESGNIYGPDVKVILTLKESGDTVIKYIPAALASMFVLHNDIENGDVYSSARIDFGNVIDVWGGSV